jgi:hypothetical protein
MARKHNLAEVLQTEVTGSMPLKTLAKVLASKGRRGDTMLAHITPKEAKKLKKMGGSGTTNPETGLPEFFDGEDFTTSFQPVDVPQAPETFTPQQGPSYSDLGITSGGQTYGPDISAAPAVVYTSGYQSPDIALSNYTGTPLEGSRYDAGFGPAYNYAPYVATAGGQEYGPAAPVASPEAIQSQIAAAGGAFSPPALGPEQGPPAPQTDEQQKKAPDQQKSFTDKLLAGLSEPKNLLGLGIAGAGGLMGYLGQQRAAQQAKAAQAQIAAAYNQAAQQQKDLAAPLIGPGYTQLSQALQGALSPANQQAYQIAQARAAQASARSGGVGAVQTALQEEGLRQQLLAGQQAQALALIAPGNTMLQNAIQNQINATTQGLGMSLQLQQQANQAANQMYAALGGAVAGGMLKG